MKRLLAAAALAFVAACTSVGGTALTPAQSVYQLKSDYDAALTIAVTYKNLPPCGTTTNVPNVGAQKIVLCSDPKVVAQLLQADNVAYAAIQAAENTVRDPTVSQSGAQAATVAAQQALAALTSITATLQTK